MARTTIGKVTREYESNDGTAHVQYIVHYRIDAGERATHEYPGSPPELEITEAQIVLVNVGDEQGIAGLVHDLLTELVTGDCSLHAETIQACIDDAADRECDDRKEERDE